MSQDFKYSYKDAFLEVTLEAQNDEHSWGNVHDLIEATLKIIKCSNDWKKCELYVVVKSQGKSQDDWKPAPDLA